MEIAWARAGKRKRKPYRNFRVRPRLAYCLICPSKDICPKTFIWAKTLEKQKNSKVTNGWYERTFTAPEESENVFLVFEGVDCLVEYFINGKLIGTSENMLIAHEFNVGGFLKDEENTLTVHISSAVIAINEEEYTVHSMMSWGNGATGTALRRAPHKRKGKLIELRRHVRA